MAQEQGPSEAARFAGAFAGGFAGSVLAVGAVGAIGLAATPLAPAVIVAAAYVGAKQGEKNPKSVFLPLLAAVRSLGNE